MIRYLSSAIHTESEHDFAGSWRKRSDAVYLTHPQKKEGWGIGWSFHLNFKLFNAPHLQRPCPKAGQTKFTVYRHKVFDFACGRAVGHYSDFKLIERL